MKNANTSFVAIIGGLWILDNAWEAEEAKKMARELGGALACAGLGLVVYFSDDTSLEPYVVSGYIEALRPGSGTGLIRVRFPESQKTKVRFAEQATHPTLFAARLFPGRDWEAPFYQSLVDADGVDAVLLMAGARSTLIAGQIAMARFLPVLAIDKFGGSAGNIRTELATHSKDYPSSATHDVQQSIAWLKQKCEVRAQQQAALRRREKKYLATVSQRSKTGWATAAFSGLLITVFFGVARLPNPEYYSFLMFAGLITAGATGALVRSIIWGTEETLPATSSLLGGVAGFVVGVAYLIPQLIGAPGVLDPAATVVASTAKIQFVSAVLVAISAGVGFDTVFTRMKAQAGDHNVSPPRDHP